MMFLNRHAHNPVFLTLCAIAYSADDQQIIAAEKGWAAAVVAKDFARLRRDADPGSYLCTLHRHH